jgi:hypothetical protein
MIDRQIIRFIDEAHPEEMGVMGIIVSTTTATSAHAWVEEYNRQFTGISPNTVRFRIEREIVMDTMLAVVVYPYEDVQGVHEEYTYEKRLLIVKDGKLFDIGVRTNDPEKIWNSFKFE